MRVKRMTWDTGRKVGVSKMVRVIIRSKVTISENIREKKGMKMMTEQLGTGRAPIMIINMMDSSGE